MFLFINCLKQKSSWLFTSPKYLFSEFLSSQWNDRNFSQTIWTWEEERVPINVQSYGVWMCTSFQITPRPVSSPLISSRWINWSCGPVYILKPWQNKKIKRPQQMVTPSPKLFECLLSNFEQYILLLVFPVSLSLPSSLSRVCAKANVTISFAALFHLHKCAQLSSCYRMKHWLAYLSHFASTNQFSSTSAFQK